tara:strand:- start:255 stop:629 length:375 start_codon:yes stop_codon:yes gene_type:complete
MLKKLIGKRQKRFIINAIVVWGISQITLHILIVLINISIATLTSSLLYIFLGFKFYGKNVFAIKKYSKFSFIKFLGMSFILWIGNFYGIHFFNSIFNNKNISAIIMIPILAMFSFTSQKYFVFK